MLELEPKPERIIVMVQKEVAERICAMPGDMSLLSVAVQYYGEPKVIARVPSGSFWPRPAIESAVVEVDLETSRRTSPLPSPKRRGINEGAKDRIFFSIVRAGFAHKRKQLWRNLSEGFICRLAR